MFKLESYITPIILSYVEKYVKNVKAERSQVSLWGGDAVFSNLDLRLDVLERELGLPFSFVSGHVHELQIHVPWTRLHAEPIEITINTIECVLKLPDGPTKSSSSRESSEASFKDPAGNPNSEKKKKRKQQDQVQAPPSYVQSLINKIISNVKIVCNNLILKYVEEDIVLSLNTRWLCLSSANAIWEPAFVELSLPDLVLRKLLQVKDMTVCLDKRDASGKIETYQEPLLYRCSLSVHAAWLYDSLHSKIPRTSRYDFRSSRMDFSLTDTQLPMFQRICALLLALYYGDLHQMVDSNNKDPAHQGRPHRDYAIDMPDDLVHPGMDDPGGGGGGSWTGWAWQVGSSVGTALLPIYWEEEEDEAHQDPSLMIDLIREKVVHIGLYVDSASLVIKRTERQPKDGTPGATPTTSNIGTGPLGATRLAFTPFLRIDVNGFFQSVKAIGVHTVNVSGGLSEIRVLPLGDCVCGARDTVIKAPVPTSSTSSSATPTKDSTTTSAASDDKSHEPSSTSSSWYFYSGQADKRSFLRGSLFEKDFGDEEGQCKERKTSYKIEWDQHLNTVTEEHMLDRTPAFALDLLYHLELPDDFDSEQMSAMSTLEHSGLEERALCRVVLGPSHLIACSGSLHRLQAVQHYLSFYDYVPYRTLMVEAGLAPVEDLDRVGGGVHPILEAEEPEALRAEIDKLVAYVPTRVYQLTAINPQLSVYMSDHPALQMEELSKHKKSKSESLGLLTSPFIGKPHFTVKLECLDSQASVPMYPKRLVDLAVATKNPELEAACHLSAAVKFLHLSVQLNMKDQSVTCLQPSNLQMTLKYKERPEAWGDEVLLQDYTVDVQTLKFVLTRPQCLLLEHILATWKYNVNECLGASSILEDTFKDKGLPGITATLSGAQLCLALTEKITTVQLHIADCSAILSNNSGVSIPILSQPSSRIVVTGSRLVVSDVHQAQHGGVTLSPGRAQPRSKLEPWLQAHVQFPRAHEKQNVLSLAALNVGEIHFNMDAKLLEWILYDPGFKSKTKANNQSSKVPKTSTPVTIHSGRRSIQRESSNKSIGQSHHGRWDKRSSVSPSGPRAAKSHKSDPNRVGVGVHGKSNKVHHRSGGVKSSNMTEKDTSTAQPESSFVKDAKCDDNDERSWHKVVFDFCTTWFPTFNAMLIQVEVEPLHIFVPKKSVAFASTKPTKFVKESLESSKIPYLATVLPTIILENVAHKPMIQQFLVKKPFEMPTSVWNIHRDNLPWTLKLKDFFAFTCNRRGDKNNILEPVTTSCTIGLNAKRLMDGFGLCVHADMSSLEASITEDQLAHIIHFAEELLVVFSKLQPDIFLNGSQQNSDHLNLSGRSPKQSDKDLQVRMSSASIQGHSPEQSQMLSETTATREHLSDLDAGDSSSGLSFWVQWTVPQMVATLITSSGQKLQAVVEDYQSSFDWTPVYFQMKFRVLSASVRHFIMSPGGGGDKNSVKWIRGKHTGTILTFGDEVTHDLVVVNAKSNALEPLSHSRHYEKDKTCFSLVFTRAECKNVHKKWQELVKNKTYRNLLFDEDEDGGGQEAATKINRDRFLSELDLKVAPFDLVLATKVLMPFLKMVSRVMYINLPPSLLLSNNIKSVQDYQNQEDHVVGMEVNNNTLPLLYIKSKTVRVFVITDQEQSKTASNPASQKIPGLLKPDVMLFNIDSFVICPQADNSLSRILIKPELYHLSQPVLDIPGSSVEDRQYQVDVKGVGVFTGSWVEIEKKSTKPEKPMVLRSMGENPALEWNTANKPYWEESEDVVLMPLIDNFEFQVIFAPAIVFSDGGAEKLVAGHSLEVNVKSDLMVVASLNQVLLCSVLTQEILATCNVLLWCSQDIHQKPEVSGFRPSTSSLDSGMDNVSLNNKSAVDDSKVEAASSQIHPDAIEIKAESMEANAVRGQRSASQRFVPVEVLVTGSKVVFVLYKLADNPQDAPSSRAIIRSSMWRKFRHKSLEKGRGRRISGGGENVEASPVAEESDCSMKVGPKMRMRSKHDSGDVFGSSKDKESDIGYDASEEGSIDDTLTSRVVLTIHPLIHGSLSQPHLFVTCSSSNQKLEVSCFDASFNIAPSNYFITCSGGHHIPGAQDYPSSLFSTRPGDPDKKSGIPPSLLTLSAHDFLSGSLQVMARLDRPLKINYNLNVIKELGKIQSEVQKSLCLEDIGQLLNSMKTGRFGGDSIKEEQNTSLPIANNGLVDSLRHNLAPLSKLTVTTRQVVLSIPAKPASSSSSREQVPNATLLLGFMGSRAEVDMTSRFSQNKNMVMQSQGTYTLEKILARTIYKESSHKLLGPWTLDMTLGAVWQESSSSPVLTIAAHSHILTIDIGPNHILGLSVIETVLREELLAPASDQEEVEEKDEGKKILDGVEDDSHEQNYIDDLRAGAFQFVEKQGRQMPKPYQIVFNDNPASLTWRYPQPRTLTRVSVFPVPFMAASNDISTSGHESEQEVLCALQYWDECLSSFRTYSEFMLSEQQVSHLDLPLVSDHKKVAISAIWRIQIHYNNDDEFDNLEDSADQECPKVIITPKALVTVVRVDSFYSPRLIPKLQASVKLDQVNIHLVNHMEKLVKTYQATGVKPFPMDQRVASFGIDSTNIGVDTWLKNGSWREVNVRLKSQVSVDFVEVGMMSRHHFLAPAPVQVQAHLLKLGGQPLIETQVHCKKLGLRFGHFANDTLYNVLTCWQSVLSSSQKSEASPLPVTNYVIKNNCHEAVRIGQADTEENVLLLPTESIMYVWRTNKARLLLRLCVESGFWKWCQPFSLHEEGTLVRKVDHGTHVSCLHVTLKRLSPTKFSILLNGSISTASLLRENLEVKLILKPEHSHLIKDSGTGGGRDGGGLRSNLKSFSSSQSFLFEAEYVHCIKIRLSGIGTPWSGDIPMAIDKARRSSVLVRIPHKDKSQCMTIWCRLVEEHDVANGAKRSLFIFSPMYMAKSSLPNPMKLVMSPNGSPGAALEVELRGRETPTQLETPQSADTKYHLSFQVAQDLPLSEPFVMSWGIIEQVRDKSAKIPPIDEIIENVSGFETCPRWPYVIPNLAGTMDTMEEAVMNEQPKTDVQVNFTQFHPLCNTICAEVNPWCLVVNRLGPTLLLKESQQPSVFSIAYNSVLVPPPLLNTTFHFGLLDAEGHESFGPPLQLTDQEWHFRSLMPSVEGMVPMEGITQSKVNFAEAGHMCMLTIESRNEKGMRVIDVKPTMNLVNATGMSLSVAVVAVFGKHEVGHGHHNMDYVAQELEPDENKSVPALFWQTLASQNGSAVGGLFDGYQHLAIKCSDSNWSRLLDLDDCRVLEQDVRKSISVPLLQPSEFANRPFFVTVHQRRGQVYLVIQKDEQPQYLIHNHLNRSLLFVHLDSKSSGFFRPKHEDIQDIGKHQCKYYTSPASSTWLNKVESRSNAYKLSFATSQKQEGGDEKDWEIVDQDHHANWSVGIDTSLQHEHFSCIPGYGDVTIQIEMVANTTHVFVQPVSKIEVSAKEIRSRISANMSGGNMQSPGSVGSMSVLSLPTSPASTSEITESEAESFDTTTTAMLEKSFHTVHSPGTRPTSASAKSLYHSCHSASRLDESSVNSSNNNNHRREVRLSLYCEELSFALSDDCIDSHNEIDEFFKITMDSLVIGLKPWISFSQPLRSLNNALPCFKDLSIIVGNIQVDNQMFHKGLYDFPVLLKSQETTSGSRDVKIKLPAFNQPEYLVEQLRSSSLVVAKISLDANTDQSVIKAVHIRVKPLNIFVEDVFAYKISQVMSSFSLPPMASTSGSGLCESNVALQEVLLSSKNLSRHLLLDSLNIEPLHVLVSVHAAIKMYVGLDQSPLNFGSFHRESLLTTNYSLGQSLARHYISGALFRAGWVVGSLEMIGSPAGFTRAVGDGIKDFVSMPYNGIFNGPWAFLSGMTNGSTSLVKHVSAGTLTSVTNFASSVSRNLDRLSLDHEHQHRNEVARRSRPQGLGQGFVNGLSGIGISLLGAVGGIAHHPIQSLINHGASPTGLVGGLTRGLVGVVTKPLGGAAELVAQTGQGLLVGTGWAQQMKQRSPVMPLHICDASSASLKFSWKLDYDPILAMVDVVQESHMSASTLILTPEAVFVVTAEEDSQEAAYALSDLDVEVCPEDPTRFTLLVHPPRSQGSRENSEGVANERVVQFVMESGLHVTVSDLEDSDYETKSTKLKKNNKKDTTKFVTFFAGPTVRTAFVEAFQVALSQFRGSGFAIL